MRDCSYLSTQQPQWQQLCPDDVELHSFEVWAPLGALGAIKLLPLTPRREESDDPTEPTEEEAAAAEAEMSETLASLGASPRIGEASAKYKDLCLVAGEIGVSIGRVYTSLTAFTDADSAGTAQFAATRLLLRKAGNVSYYLSFTMCHEGNSHTLCLHHRHMPARVLQVFVPTFALFSNAVLSASLRV